MIFIKHVVVVFCYLKLHFHYLKQFAEMYISMIMNIQVRHAQGLHNLEEGKSRDPLTSIDFTDPELSSHGWQQVIDSSPFQ